MAHLVLGRQVPRIRAVCPRAMLVNTKEASSKRQQAGSFRNETRMSGMWPARLRIVILVSFVLLGGDLAGTSAHQSADGDHVWKLYTNVRFEYAICYPEDLLVPQGKSANSDGQKFLAKDGAELLVFGQNNALDQSLKEALADTQSRLASPPGKMTYKALTQADSPSRDKTPRRSSTRGPGDSHEQYKSIELNFNKSAAAIYKPLIDRLTA